MFNKAIGALAEKEIPKTNTTIPAQNTSLSEQDFEEPEPEGKEETMLSPIPPKPVDVRITAGGGLHLKNPA